ncbi:MAG: hypothetical protein IJU95_07085 [Treponema sp.]|nr:hypothetical protein [Treponema sp.]
MKRFVFFFLFVVLTLSPLPVHDTGGSAGAAFCAEACVCVTKKGKKFHTAGCRVIKDSEVQKMTRKEAENKGYTACKICKP